MRKLNRPQTAPQCLSKYDYNTQLWKGNIPSSKCKSAIWTTLNTMQNGFCVYCESVAVKGNGHIEHFFHKGKKADETTPYKDLTFDWSNLFGCCGRTSSNTCGHFKDRQGNQGPGAYNGIEIIKPDVDEPLDFFSFLDTGVIEPKSGLSPEKNKRASETIRVLNLSYLNGARKKQIDIFKRELNELIVISHQLNEQIFRQEIVAIKEKVKQQEFQTAVLEALFN